MAVNPLIGIICTLYFVVNKMYFSLETDAKIVAWTSMF